MARSVLLDTSTVSFQDLLGNGKSYEVPLYQRDYSWRIDHWEDLWQDVLAVYGNREFRHYMGSVVFQGAGDKRFSVIDGQQRLATLSVLVLAVIQRIHELTSPDTPDANTERIEILSRSFIGDKAPTSLLWSSKLKLNDNNDNFWQEYIIQRRTPPRMNALNDSERLLYKAYRYFHDQLGTIPELCTDGERLAAFLTEAVASRLLFIQILVEDELSAYTVFETLNARGVELTATDLLKNYLFSRITADHDLRILQRQWKRIAGIVGTNKFPDFLRHLVNSQQEFIRSQRLFKVMRERVSTAPQVLDLLETLEIEADTYRSLFDHTHEQWRGNREARRMIRALEIFRVRQFAPLLLAVFRRFDEADRTRVLRVCEVISFRYNVIGNRNTNELEKQYNLAAIAVHEGQAGSVADVSRILLPVYVTDEEFRTDFAYKAIPATGTKRHLVRYILANLESDASGRDVDFDGDPFTIEHILPQNPGAGWNEDFPPEIQEAWISRIGNYTPIEAALNRDLVNDGFAAKRAAYYRSQYETTKSLQAEEWSPATLQQRQEAMARRAVHIWRIDH
ncbi:MAG: DUF262 domain-containing protein [Bacteroidetes bacterium]|nr:DUF262 domain-containing protein [Bacteroidota bacterium]